MKVDLKEREAAFAMQCERIPLIAEHTPEQWFDAGQGGLWILCGIDGIHTLMSMMNAMHERDFRFDGEA